ncbi:MAG: hypothetical protein K6C14_01070 [Eubacterium sp.]|nr:hypothetical protein [Eubacterium sp.]
MKRLSDSILLFLLFALTGTFCIFSSEAKSGALSGLEMCEKIIIPSLLPILIICSLIIKSRASLAAEALFGRLFTKLFNIPESAAPAVIFGLAGGYPTGAVLTLGLIKEGRINKEQASRIMRIAFSPGFAFTFTAVGTVTYGSTKTGGALLSVITVSAVTVMLISSIKKPKPEGSADCLRLPFSDALCEAAESSVKALAVMSAHIILFSALISIIKPPVSIYPLLEITSGVCLREVPLPLPECAFFLSFGGLCIHLQLYGILRKMEIRYREFLFFRLLNASLSYILMKLYLTVFPQSLEVFGGLYTRRHEFPSGGLTLSLVMITGCAVLVFDIENRKLKLI